MGVKALWTSSSGILLEIPLPPDARLPPEQAVRVSTIIIAMINVMIVFKNFKKTYLHIINVCLLYLKIVFIYLFISHSKYNLKQYYINKHNRGRLPHQIIPSRPASIDFTSLGFSASIKLYKTIPPVHKNKKTYKRCACGLCVALLGWIRFNRVH